MLSSHKKFKNIFILSELAGLCLPVSPDVSIMSASVLNMYSLLTAINNAINIMLLLYLIVGMWESVRDLTLTAFALFLCIYTLFVTIYFYFSRNRVAQFLKRFDATVLTLYTHPLCKQTAFLSSLDKLA